ncbi:helix-turn-helix transcriptional regulator [Sphingobacterium sp. Mn56C]|uniref:helix-turn-helix transcriptional regulator n=1 Tax=Sphingobacterium sp. Mn56C TaxID=3395261 RepID=UPI003BCAF2B3
MKPKNPVVLELKKANVTKVNLAFTDKVTIYMPYAKGINMAIPEGNIITQHYNNYLFFMESVELVLEQEVIIRFRIRHHSLLLFFMLQGKALFTNGNDDILGIALGKNCYGTMIEEGDYTMKFTSGKHRFFYASLNTDWIRSEEPSFSRLQDFILLHQNLKFSVSFMKKIYLSDAMNEVLKCLLQKPNNRRDSLDETLTFHLKQLIKDYSHAQDYKNYLLGLSKKEKIHEIKKYLKKHFYKKDITKISFLCEKFNITERTLRRAFSAESESPISYILRLRLAHSRDLLLKTDCNVSHIAMKCGFNSSNYFSRLFRKNFDYSPEEYRSQFANSIRFLDVQKQSNSSLYP